MEKFYKIQYLTEIVCVYDFRHLSKQIFFFYMMFFFLIKQMKNLFKFFYYFVIFLIKCKKILSRTNIRCIWIVKQIWGVSMFWVVCGCVNQCSLWSFTTQARQKVKSTQTTLAFRGVASQNSIPIAKTPIPQDPWISPQPFPGLED